MTKAVDRKLAAGMAKARAKLSTLVTVFVEDGTYQDTSGGLIGETTTTYENVELMGWGPVSERYIEDGTALATATEAIADPQAFPFTPVLSDQVGILVQKGTDRWRVVHIDRYRGADDIAAYLFVMAQA